MCIELNRSAYLSLLARGAAIFRERANEAEQERHWHDRAVNIKRARQLEKTLASTRSTLNTFNLIDDRVESLLNMAGFNHL